MLVWYEDYNFELEEMIPTDYSEMYEIEEFESIEGYELPF